jgi:hypothetical protein
MLEIMVSSSVSETDDANPLQIYLVVSAID